MKRNTAWLQLTIGTRVWPAQLRRDLSPRACAILEGLLPLRGLARHARWSGEALWAPLAPVWPRGLLLPPENATGRPRPGDALLFAGPRSEPELLLPYGACRFACRAGRLAGSPVLTLEGDLALLRALGQDALMTGAAALKIEVLSPEQSPRQ